MTNLTTNPLAGQAPVAGCADAKCAPLEDAHHDSASQDNLSGDDRDRLRARLERKHKTDATRTLPADDPAQWVGKKVRSKKTGATYVIRQVYKSNRVELEKSWMTYSSDVPAIRSDYEICF